MKKFSKLSRTEMKKVTGGKVDPNCLSSGTCAVVNSVGITLYGTCDGINFGTGLCGCTVNGVSYATSVCSRF
ncbi:bacteriocin-like protein [Mucilaginibacter xinganensis]|nr:hypothetical protein [Mucilaginibacter xinganensis]